jgi:hypothetical protein
MRNDRRPGRFTAARLLALSHARAESHTLCTRSRKPHRAMHPEPFPARPALLLRSPGFPYPGDRSRLWKPRALPGPDTRPVPRSRHDALHAEDRFLAFRRGPSCGAVISCRHYRLLLIRDGTATPRNLAAPPVVLLSGPEMPPRTPRGPKFLRLLCGLCCLLCLGPLG